MSLYVTVLSDHMYDTYGDDMSYLWIMDEPVTYTVLMSYTGLDATLCRIQVFYHEIHMESVLVHSVHTK